MRQAALVAVFGACGALARYGVGTAFASGARRFPWPTFAINVVGSFLLGVVVTVAGHRLSTQAATAIGAGFLGAFTTFSAFSVETVRLIEDERFGAAAGYVALSVLAGVAAAAVGIAVGRTVVR